MKKKSLEDRMKSYENKYKKYLPFGTPKIIRVDLRSGKTFTKHLSKPFDDVFSDCMVSTMKYLCANIPGARFGYTQSDEITIVIKDINKENQEISFFNNSLTKICSIVASMATLEFNKVWDKQIIDFLDHNDISENDILHTDKYKVLEPYILNRMEAMFDCRYFELPNTEEVCNNLVWRQNDCYRNAVNQVAVKYFKPKELESINTEGRIDMLSKKGIKLNNYSQKYFRGVICYKLPYKKDNNIKYKWQDNIAQNFISNFEFIDSLYNGNNLFDEYKGEK